MRRQFPIHGDVVKLSKAILKWLEFAQENLSAAVILSAWKDASKELGCVTYLLYLDT